MYHNLPMTLSDEGVYNQLRNAITGGISNVIHRWNIKDETKINKLYYDNLPKFYL